MGQTPRTITRKRVIYQVFLGIGLVSNFYFIWHLGTTQFTTLDVKGQSMLPTLATGDEVVIAKSPALRSHLQYGQLVKVKKRENGTSTMVKRVVGLPGDHIVIKKGKLFRNGKEVNEPYLNEEHWFSKEPVNQVLKENEIYVMGDNRNHSTDSRTLGAINLDTQFEAIVFKKIN